ncbi:MAG TPA: DNA polymerase III subunit delta [Candidatus Binatia bacterium]|nr:DNA polymerase III subunit delta [Candidatus Binatia bacterium]
MKIDLKTILGRLEAERGPRLLLVFGEDAQVASSCKTILDRLVPEGQRAFNLERFDGRSVSWEQIEASLMTPPFFPGTKLLWVESAPYFYAREQSGELGQRVLELWGNDSKDDAAKLLLDLLVVQGWSQEQWNALENGSPAALFELLGADGTDQDHALALLNYCKNRPMDLSKRKGAEANRLSALLDQGLPEWSFLLMTAVQVDRRTRLFKRLEEIGAVLHLALERDRSGRISREALLEAVGQQLQQTGKSLAPAAREMIVARAGDDLRGLQQELEKLALFVGNRPTILPADVELMMTDRGEGWVFDLTRALGDRDAASALRQLARLLAQGEHPLRILGTVTTEARRLLSARQLLAGELRKLWRRDMSYTQFQQTILNKGGSPLGGRNPFGDYMCFRRAERFSLAELRSFMQRLFESDLSLKSSAAQPRLVLEKLFLEICLGTPRAHFQRPSLRR